MELAPIDFDAKRQFGEIDWLKGQQQIETLRTELAKFSSFALTKITIKRLTFRIQERFTPGERILHRHTQSPSFPNVESRADRSFRVA